AAGFTVDARGSRNLGTPGGRSGGDRVAAGGPVAAASRPRRGVPPPHRAGNAGRDDIMRPQPVAINTGVSALKWAATDTWVVARRHLMRMVRRPDELLGTLLIPVMAIAMFGFVFGDAFGAAMAVPGSQYREFLLPGLFVLTMA